MKGRWAVGCRPRILYVLRHLICFVSRRQYHDSTYGARTTPRFYIPTVASIGKRILSITLVPHNGLEPLVSRVRGECVKPVPLMRRITFLFLTYIYYIINFKKSQIIKSNYLRRKQPLYLRVGVSYYL